MLNIILCDIWLENDTHFNIFVFAFIYVSVMLLLIDDFKNIYLEYLALL